MKETSTLEKVERISVIIASILGAIAFFWQATDYLSSRKEKIDAVLWCNVEKYSLDSPQLSLVVSNIGERPIYLSHISFRTSDTVTSDPSGAFIPHVSPEIGSGPYAADLIEAGASRDYYIDIPVQDLANYKSIYLVVSSTRGELKRIGDLAPAIERFVRLLNKSEKDGWGTRYLYVCDQPYVGEPP